MSIVQKCAPNPFTCIIHHSRKKIPPPLPGYTILTSYKYSVTRVNPKQFST